MITNIRKRDGRVVPFETEKIAQAIFKAAQAVGGENIDLARNLARKVEQLGEKQFYQGEIPAVEDIQDLVEKTLIENGHARTAKAYILYRDKRSRIREAKTELMDVVSEILLEKDDTSQFTPAGKMFQIAKAVSRHYYLTNLLPTELAESHLKGLIHIHDLAYYTNSVNNVCIDLLKTVSGNRVVGLTEVSQGALEDTFTKFSVLLREIQEEIIGEQNYPGLDTAVGKLMRQTGIKDYSKILAILRHVLLLNTAQYATKRSSISFGVGTDTTVEGKLVTRALLELLEDMPLELDQPLVVFKLKKGINMSQTDPNFDLFKAATLIAINNQTVSFSLADTTYNNKYPQACYFAGSQRLANNQHAKSGSVGRGSLATVSINLPRIALMAKNEDLFFTLLEETMQLTMRQLLHRFEILGENQVREWKLIMGQGLYAGSSLLQENDSVRQAIVNGTLCIGFVGLAEALVSLIGYHHGQTDNADALAQKTVKFMRAKCDDFADYYDLNVVLFATSAVRVRQRLISLDRDEYGQIDGVTDSPSYTHSFHLPRYAKLSTLNKLMIEGRFHRYCNGGHEFVVDKSMQFEQTLDLLALALHHDVGYIRFNY